MEKFVCVPLKHVVCPGPHCLTVNRNNVMLLYNKLQELLNRHPAFSNGSRIYNLNETGVTTVQCPKKVLTEKGTKRLNMVTSAERGPLITVCRIINAYGQSIPPTIIFPRVLKILKITFLMESQENQWG